MRVLLDECVHSKVGRLLSAMEVRTVPEVGWRGVKNGELLRIAAAEYDVFITSDKNLEYQHNKDLLPLPVIVIATTGNMWEDIEPVIPQIKALLDTKLKNEFYSVK
jgi:predicted nuclease of predicted toxin-antitoxin system